MHYYRYIVSRSEFVKLLPADARPMDIQNMYSRLLSCCSKLWAAVRSILCFDAPEGRDLHDDDDDDDETDKGSKDMLSFCWRALKESRSVFATSTLIAWTVCSCLLEQPSYACGGKSGLL